MSNIGFSIVWGLLFGGIPLIAIICNYIQDNIITYYLFPFVIIGASVFIHGLISFFKLRKYHRIQQTGKLTTGIFISMEQDKINTSNPRFYINYKYTTINGETKVCRTPTSYDLSDTLFYKSLKNFEVRYNEKDSVITEKVNFSSLSQPEMKSLCEQYNQIIGNDKVKHKEISEEIRNKPITFLCEHCGYVQNKPGKCDCCGARVVINKNEKNIKK